MCPSEIPIGSTPLVSVIIPVYKVEKYLRRCVDSVLIQSYSNLEIFLVNDGSPDNCGKICDDYSKADSRIKVIHKENGGLSDARNAAIDLAEGKYITFIDSDDFVTIDYIETLVSLAVSHDADIAVSQFVYYRDNGEYLIHQPKETTKVFDSRNAIETMLYQRDFETSAWGKLYRVSLFKGDVRYPKGLLYEDLATTYKLIALSNRIAVTNKISYYYYLRDDSIIGNNFSPKKMDILTIANNMLRTFEDQMPGLLLPLKCRLTSLYLTVFLQIKQRNEFCDILWYKIKEYRNVVLFDNNARLKTRLACLLSYFGSSSIRFFFNFINERK
ncbi:glycosyltransferase family 2 protein [Arcticibacter tournemirensis]|uniref:Glycosyltransferase n=1 Tax=Arcticibacter tournemirensis TaxID=699437 RepID=A0A4Q0M8A7_9SPHI|nr:glycosyltransferase [Arcticibacter tournemirensis]RXF69357.1 glycosyltransferase [Arcticibacter tournemirensis]